MSLIRFYIGPAADGWKVTARGKRVLRSHSRTMAIDAAVAAAQTATEQGARAEVHIDEGRRSLRQIWPIPRRSAGPWRVTIVPGTGGER
jgi:hypothetical protein